SHSGRGFRTLGVRLQEDRTRCRGRPLVSSCGRAPVLQTDTADAVHSAFTRVGSNQGMSRQYFVAFAAIGAASVSAAVGIRFVLTRQAAIARRRIGKPLGEQSIDADRVWRRALDGDPVQLLVLGDSVAA